MIMNQRSIVALVATECVLNGALYRDLLQS